MYMKYTYVYIFLYIYINLCIHVYIYIYQKYIKVNMEDGKDSVPMR